METILRVVLIYFVILVGLRILGKREFGQLSPLELISLLLIPELVAQSIIREDFSLTNALIGVTTLFSLVFLTSLVRHLNQKFEHIISGKPCILISHGEFLSENLNKERIDPDEIYGEMRNAGLASIEQVRWAILETDGKISFIPEDEQSHSAHRSEDKNTVS